MSDTAATALRALVRTKHIAEYLLQRDPQLLEQCRKAIGLGPVLPDHVPDCGEEYRCEFWRKSQYADYEEALAAGAVQKGEVCYGYTSFMDSMCNVRAALECCGMADDGLTYRLWVDDKLVCESGV